MLASKAIDRLISQNEQLEKLMDKDLTQTQLDKIEEILSRQDKVIDAIERGIAKNEKQ